MKRINRFKINVKKAIALAKRFYKGELVEKEKDELINLLLDTLIDVRHLGKMDLIQVQKTLLTNKRNFDTLENIRKESQQ